MAKRTRKLSLKDRMEKTLTTISSPTFNLGFSCVDKWISSGNYALNRLWSGRFDRAMMFGRSYIYYGESGSGKSLGAAIACANAQKEHGALIVWIDVEKATDDEAGKQWLTRAGVDVDEIIYATAATLEEIKKTISSICVDYREMDEEERAEMPPIVFVVDSWSAALTEAQWDQAEKGVVKGDQGQKAKQTGDLILQTTHLVGSLPIMVIGVAHIMDDTDMYSRRKHKTTGGNKMIYMASGALMLTKAELDSEDVDDDEVKEKYKRLRSNQNAKEKRKKKFAGIVSTVEILKSRVSKPFEKVQIQIPYDKGLDPYSGLFEVLVQEEIITSPSKGWYAYVDRENPKSDADGVVKFQKGSFRDHAERLMEISNNDISNVSDNGNGDTETVSEDVETE